ncbi:hypothetical protein FRACYDRAFT_245024 [Fragilariopsis cylindrus CCMP1102]|uniref:Uncharacterized protein n=1 Tax=Fragilariopsis cylindrus CCMP1102 TaxID=635003 RepID=A0A1E7F249_9STRA|nr:hypothetical protein FRACYDRAFT_245024 [Fragilariopsis cylindrus CCMP1102]|eukprot:OEU11903.1 hypothetical protein FRACYDRAFT_245024 [Fragilariopsis cylindrus CCMP1102]
MVLLLIANTVTSFTHHAFTTATTNSCRSIVSASTATSSLYLLPTTAAFTKRRTSSAFYFANKNNDDVAVGDDNETAGTTDTDTDTDTDNTAKIKEIKKLFDIDEIATTEDTTKAAMEIKKIFDIDEMGYTIMIRDEYSKDSTTGDYILTPTNIITAIQQDSMFGEDFEDYYQKYNTNSNTDSDNTNDSIQILDIGKYSDDFSTCTPLPIEQKLTIEEKGNYLVNISLTKDISTTIRISVD